VIIWASLLGAHRNYFFFLSLQPHGISRTRDFSVTPVRESNLILTHAREKRVATRGGGRSTAVPEGRALPCRSVLPPSLPAPSSPTPEGRRRNQRRRRNERRPSPVPPRAGRHQHRGASASPRAAPPWFLPGLWHLLSRGITTRDRVRGGTQEGTLGCGLARAGRGASPW